MTNPLLPATLMGFPWRLEKSDIRQKYIDFQEKNFVSCQGQSSKIECNFIVPIDVKKQQPKVHLPVCWAFVVLFYLQSRIFEKDVRCSKVKLSTGSILCETSLKCAHSGHIYLIKNKNVSSYPFVDLMNTLLP